MEGSRGSRGVGVPLREREGVGESEPVAVDLEVYAMVEGDDGVHKRRTIVAPTSTSTHPLRSLRLRHLCELFCVYSMGVFEAMIFVNPEERSSMQ
jgi:hypothetical protein